MPQYRLTYFNLRGRAEPVRWVLAAAEQPYQDQRYNRETEWPLKKSETPYGKVPVLYVDGQPLSQSVAICRYLGRAHDLATDDPWLSAVGDEVVDAIHDLLPHVAQIVYTRRDNDLQKSKLLATEFFTSVLPPTLRELEKKIQKNTWFCGDKMTWVDVFSACYLSQLSTMNQDALESAPKVKQLVDRVLALPSIESWVKERPETPM